MEAKDVPRSKDEKPPIWQRDRPGCIKYILLLLLLLLLAAEIGAGEFGAIREKGGLIWGILILKLILIALLVTLIRVQKSLFCKLTEPTGCTEEKPNPAAGELTVPVKGTASGAAFGSYILEVRKVGFPSPIPDAVRYPGGGTSGATPVNNDQLGELVTTGFDEGAYEITLTVYPAWGGSPKTCTISFTLLKATVYISRVGKIPVISHVPTPDNPNPFYENAELHKDFAGSPPPHDYQLVSVGGKLTIDGAAYIYECPGRKIARYEIRYAQVATPGPMPSQPPTDAPIPATWPALQRVVELLYSTPDHYKPWTKVGPASRPLTNTWTTFSFNGTTHFKLQEFKWDSGSLSGRYSLLLIAEDTTPGPHRYYDIQHAWIDNKPIKGKITGVAGVKPCAVFHLNDFVGSSVDIQGLAWDPLIDEDFDPNLVPNDNFGGYELRIYKQGVSAPYVITTSNTRVPAAKTGPPGFPTDADAGTLASFDIAAALDADNPSPPPGVPAAIKVPRKTGCAYYFELYVWDKTRINDDSTNHHIWSRWPICVDNDIGSKT
jgi:hypothetical protein